MNVIRKRIIHLEKKEKINLSILLLLMIECVADNLFVKRILIIDIVDVEINRWLCLVQGIKQPTMPIVVC